MFKLEPSPSSPSGFAATTPNSMRRSECQRDNGHVQNGAVMVLVDPHDLAHHCGGAHKHSSAQWRRKRRLENVQQQHLQLRRHFPSSSFSMKNMAMLPKSRTRLTVAKTHITVTLTSVPASSRFLTRSMASMRTYMVIATKQAVLMSGTICSGRTHCATVRRANTSGTSALETGLQITDELRVAQHEAARPPFVGVQSSPPANQDSASHTMSIIS